ncbi:hypothetical protein PRIPAC_83213 [Pristionchus pacificus]|uniref:Uncharacterized protein n=1 Tax=Pristionchus pacificus TaxID=54126 RepID=A0A2A6BV04_PRIPA|nr:hypothetical protein PRIPAC_83213 [Pristionchus pacificus]|eukprot:PDM69725.1 hypothetical protein PRIPAC_44821 [Pristionchus pacificus]
MDDNILRVGFAKNAPEANWNCPNFPTLTPRMNSCPYPGLCTELIAYFARMANMTIVATVIDSVPDEVEWGTRREHGSWSGAFGYIYNDTLDTVCLMAQRNEMRAMDFDFTSVIYQSPIALVSRELTETMPPNLWSPYEVLSLQVWMATLGGWIAFTLTLTLLEAWESGSSVYELIAIVSWRALRIQMLQGSYEESFSFHYLGNFLALIYSMTAIVVVANLYGSNTIATIMKNRTFERFQTIEEAARMVASGQLTLIDLKPSILITLLGEYSTTGTGLLRAALDSNPPRVEYEIVDTFELLQTGEYLVGEIVDSRFMMTARSQCNLFIMDHGLPELFAQLLWNRKSSEKLRRINKAIGMSGDFIERTRKKYLTLDELPFTVTRKNCTEQKRLLASQQTLDFPSTAGVFLLLLPGLVSAALFFLAELLAKRRKSAAVDAMMLTKIRRRRGVISEGTECDDVHYTRSSD